MGCLFTFQRRIGNLTKQALVLASTTKRFLQRYWYDVGEVAQLVEEGIMTALDHVRVIELANERISFAGKLLADMGADVILVEPPSGDASELPAFR